VLEIWLEEILMKILFVASEAAPLVKVGGLGDVTGSLPKALRALGHDVRLIIPQYAKLDTQRFPITVVKSGLEVSLPGGIQSIDLNQTQVNEVPVYLIENPQYFGGGEIYGTFDLERFYFFSRAVFNLLPNLDWQPEILHCHDWLTALVIMWQKRAGYPCSTVFTIHNLAYQGFFESEYLHSHNLKKDWDSFAPDAPPVPLSFMAQAIMRADLVTTVSETYAREIMTPEYGVGLDTLLRYRKDSLKGIVNGIDYSYFNPLNDLFLPVNFDSNSLSRRELNKIALQKLSGLPVNSAVPLIGMVQRLDEQKGIDIFARGIDQMMKESESQFVILGRGRDHYENTLRQIAARYPGRVAVFIAFEESLAHLIYGGSDMFLMPSRFEPCGLGQMIAMRYGALPIVRHTGGLVDTVPEFNPDLSSGNGFVFHDYTPEALAAAVYRATLVYRNKTSWFQAVERVMNLDFSLQNTALRYEKVYRLLLDKPGNTLGLP
jgi:starch synthase